MILLQEIYPRLCYKKYTHDSVTRNIPMTKLQDSSCESQQIKEKVEVHHKNNEDSESIVSRMKVDFSVVNAKCLVKEDNIAKL